MSPAQAQKTQAEETQTVFSALDVENASPNHIMDTGSATPLVDDPPMG